MGKKNHCIVFFILALFSATNAAGAIVMKMFIMEVSGFASQDKDV